MRPADAAKRVDMSEADLRAINSIPNGMVIKAGSTLLVRRAASVREDVTETVADNAQLSLGRQELQVRRIVKAGKNDSVSSLARRYSVDASSVAAWNKISASASLKQGQRVTLYVPARSKSAASAVRTASARQGTRSSKQKPVRLAKD